jgi:hypothetical protein
MEVERKQRGDGGSIDLGFGTLVVVLFSVQFPSKEFVAAVERIRIENGGMELCE